MDLTSPPSPFGSLVDETLAGLSFSSTDRLACIVLEESLERSESSTIPRISPNDSLIIASQGGRLAVSIAMLLKRRSCPPQSLTVIIPEDANSAIIPILKGLGAQLVRTPASPLRIDDETPSRVANKLKLIKPDSIIIDEWNLPNSTMCAWSSKVRAQLLLANLTPSVSTLSIYCGIEFSDGLSFALVSALARSIPESTFHVAVISNTTSSPVSDPPTNVKFAFILPETACRYARELLSYHGRLVAPVSAAATHLAKENEAKGIAQPLPVLLNLHSTMYDSSRLSDTFLDDIPATEMQLDARRATYRGASVEDLQLPAAVSISQSTTISQALMTMLDRDFSQLPVLDERKRLVGLVTLDKLQTGSHDSFNPTITPVSALMYKWSPKRAYTLITPATPLFELELFLELNFFAFVTDEERKWVLAVVTSLDLGKWAR